MPLDLPKTNQSGFTIIESLVAIVVVGILMTVVAPVIVLSVGNRVQARRVELASQAAKDYTDGIRSGAIAAPNQTISLNEVDATRQFNSQRNIFAGVAAPAAVNLSCPTTVEGYPYCSNTPTSSLYCIDLDGGGCSSNSSKDLVVQGFRSVSPSSPDADKGYVLGVRVYRADAFSDSTPLVKSDVDTKRTQATFTGGLGDRKAPLVEMATEITTDKTTFQDFCDRLGGCQ